MVNYNGKDLLQCALSSIIAKTKGLQYEIVLVDNGSIDGSAEFVKKAYPQVHLICNRQNLGYAKANNQGIRACDADNYLLLNTDIEVFTDGWLARLHKILESDETIGIVTCNQPRSKEKVIETNGPPYEVDFAAGSVLLIKKKTIENIGLLDEIFTPCLFEDTDWCHRAISSGWKILYDPSTIVIHYGEVTTKRTFAEIPRFFGIFVRNRIMYETMNHDLDQIPEDLIGELLTLGGALFKGDRKNRIWKLRCLWQAYVSVLRRSRRLLSGRQARRRIVNPFKDSAHACSENS
jgi:hypothetical protein